MTTITTLQLRNHGHLKYGGTLAQAVSPGEMFGPPELIGDALCAANFLVAFTVYQYEILFWLAESTLTNDSKSLPPSKADHDGPIQCPGRKWNRTRK
jgi:hypothetical protein